MERSVHLQENTHLVSVWLHIKLWKRRSFPYDLSCLWSGVVLTGDSLHFGVSNLEEIRLRKALKASMRKAGYPMQPANSMTNKDTENIEAFFRADLYDKAGGKKP